MLRGVLPTRGARSRRQLSLATIRVERRSWPAWVTCLGRSETLRGDRRVSCSPFKRGGLAARLMLRLRLRRLALEIRGRKVPAKKGLYANIHAKRKRIAAGSGEKMRKPGAKGAPTSKAFKESAKTARRKTA
jgi:hypothetical protein